jgi:hypothetical protein
MNKEFDPEEPSWINNLLLVATFLTLILVLVAAYKGWREDRASHYSDRAGHSEIIADITVNLSGVPHQEHCLTCHPQGRSINSRSKAAMVKEHPVIAPHSIYELGCSGCHLGEGMARDFIISHGVAGMDGMHPLRLPPEHSGPRAFLPLSWKRIRASRAVYSGPASVSLPWHEVRRGEKKEYCFGSHC